MRSIANRIADLSPRQRDRLLELIGQRDKGRRGLTEPLPPLVPRPEDADEPFALTPVQEVYWAGRSGLFDLGSGGTNLYMAFELTGAAQPLMGRFDGVLQRLIDHHPMLRCVLLPDGCQRVLAEVAPFRSRVLDVRGREGGAVAVEKLRQELSCRRGSVEEWPLFDVMAQRLEEEKIHVHVRVDALLLDGHSRMRWVQQVLDLFEDPDRDLPEIECSYRDYAVYRARFKDSPLYRRSREYWLERLAELAPAPELPLATELDPRTPAVFEGRKDSVLAPPLWERLQTRCAELGLTPSAVLTVAFAEVLSAWTPDPRFTLLMMGSHRMPVHAQIHQVLGNFSDVYLIDVGGCDLPFTERIHHFQKRLTVDREHPHFSGFEVLREWNLRHGVSSRASFPVWFNTVVEYAHPSYRQWVGRDRVETDVGTLRFLETSLYLPQTVLFPAVGVGREGDLRCNWQWAEGLLARSFVDELADTYGDFVHRLAQEKAAWRQVRPATPPDPQPRMDERPPREEPSLTLSSRVLDRARARGEQTAVLWDEGCLSYRQLWRRTTALARRLRREAVSRGDTVAVAVRGGWERMVATLGVMEAGASYLGLDPGVHGEGLAVLAKRLGIDLFLVEGGPESPDTWPGGLRYLSMEDESPLGEDEPETGHPGLHHDVAYVFDPGDSTPTPWGVGQRHLADAIEALNERFALGSSDRLMVLPFPANDQAFFEVLAPLVVGGSVAFASYSREWRAEECVESIERHGVTILSTTPTFMEGLARAATATPGHPLGGLRLILLRGERIPPALVRRLRSSVPGAAVAALWGDGRAGIWSAVGHLSQPDAEVMAFEPLGGQTLHVLGDGLAASPVGAVGRLHVHGVAVGSHRGADVAQALGHSGGLLVTADFGRKRPDGRFEVLGARQDFELRVLGYRGEAARVEDELLQEPGVRWAWVQADADGKGLVASVLVEDSVGFQVEPLLKRLGERLPYYLVPSEFRLWDRAPLRPDGTLDRTASSCQGVALPAATREPDEALLAEMADVWEEILGTRPLRPEDDLFALGPSSLAVVRIAQKVRERWGCELPLSVLFQHATLRSMTRAVALADAESSSER